MAEQLFNFGTGADSGGTSSGGNQYFNALPTLPTTNPMTVKSGADPMAVAGATIPGLAPSGSGGPVTSPANTGTATSSAPPAGGSGNSNNISTFQSITSPISNIPGVGKMLSGFFGGGENPQGDMANNFFKWLNSQIGKGATPYPGELSAPDNKMLTDLMKSFTDPNGVMNQMLNSGMPVDQTPQWKAMTEAMQRKIMQGDTNLKESFNFAGGLAGSPFGQAEADYQSQTAKDLNSQLLAAQTTALENARGRQMDSAKQEGAFGTVMQGFDQATFDRKYQEFIRTQPEYSPLLNMMFGGSTDAKQTASGGAMNMQTIMQLAQLAMML